MTEILIIIFGIIGLISVLIVMHARRTVGYVYSGAIVSAWEGKLLKETRLVEMADAPGMENLIASLEDTEYRPLLNEVLRDGEIDLESAEIAFKNHLNLRYLEILKIVPQKQKEVIRGLLKKLEIWNLKVILTAIHNGATVEENIRRYMSSPTMPSERIEMLTTARSLEQLLEFLKDSEYYAVLTTALKDYRERGLISLLSALDIYYYTSLWKTVLQSKAQRQILMKMIGCEIDIVNIKLLLRLKKEGAAPEEIAGYLIRPAYLLTEGMLRDMTYAENIRAVLDVLSKTPYGRTLLDLLPQIESQGIFIAERALNEMRLKLFRQMAITHLFSLAPVISYIQLKETEVRNLLILLRLKALKVEPQKIKEKLVVPKLEL
jgi:V/A-type H+-transporting ATPase subunit C